MTNTSDLPQSVGLEEIPPAGEEISSEAQKEAEQLEKLAKMTDNAAESIAGLKELALLDNGALAKIEKLEREIFFRQFYFPGSVVELRLPGLGTDVPGVKKYDQIPGNRYLLDHWDPRYIEDYVHDAKKFGFYRHFLYYNGEDVLPMDYDSAANIFKFIIEDGYFRKGDERLGYGLLSGLMYMDKLKSFAKETWKETGFDEDSYRDLLIYGKSYISTADIQLRRVIGQTKEDFIANDYGWYDRDLKYAFDIGHFAAEWQEKQAEYKMFKDKIWEILKNVNALQVCTNKQSGYNVGDGVTIEQQVNCALSVGDNTKTTNEKKEADVPSAVYVEKEDENDENEDDGAGMFVIPSDKSDDKTLNDKTLNDTSNDKTSNDTSNDTTNDKTTEAVQKTITSSKSNAKIIIIVVIVIILILSAGGIAFYLYKQNEQLSHTINRFQHF